MEGALDDEDEETPWLADRGQAAVPLLAPVMPVADVRPQFVGIDGLGGHMQVPDWFDDLKKLSELTDPELMRTYLTRKFNTRFEQKPPSLAQCLEELKLQLGTVLSVFELAVQRHDEEFETTYAQNVLQIDSTDALRLLDSVLSQSDNKKSIRQSQAWKDMQSGQFLDTEMFCSPRSHVSHPICLDVRPTV